MNQKDERMSSLHLANQNYQDEIAEQAAVLSSLNHRVMELQKNAEELTSRLERKTKENDTSTVELKNLRLDFNDMKSKFFEASGALENSKYDLKTQKNVYEDTLKRRDDETLALKSRIEQLNTQVEVKRMNLNATRGLWHAQKSNLKTLILSFLLQWKISILFAKLIRFKNKSWNVMQLLAASVLVKA